MGDQDLATSRNDAAWNLGRPMRVPGFSTGWSARGRGLLLPVVPDGGRRDASTSPPPAGSSSRRCTAPTSTRRSCTAVTRRPLRFMGKDSLWKSNRAMAWVLSALGGFPVARGPPIVTPLRRCQTVLEAGQPLVMYPEGTRQFGPVVARAASTVRRSWRCAPGCRSCRSASAAPNGPSARVPS